MEIPVSPFLKTKKGMSNKEIEMSDMSTVKVDIELPKGQVYNNEYIDPTLLTDKENEKVKKVIPLREEKKVTAVGVPFCLFFHPSLLLIF